MSKKSDWVFAMLNAVVILGHRAYGAHLGCLVWPRDKTLYEFNSRWICGKARAAQACARKLVRYGLLVEVSHNFGSGDFGYHFELTDAGNVFILSQIREAKESSHAN